MVSPTQAVLEAYAQRRELAHALRRYGRSRADVEDLMQQAFLRMLNADPVDIEHPFAFAFVTARRVHTNAMMLKTARMLVYLDEPNEYQRLVTPDPLQRIMEEEVLERARRSLEHLSAKTQTVFQLHCFEQWTYEEIAAHMGFSISMVKKYLQIARAEILKEPSHDGPGSNRSQRGHQRRRVCNSKAKRDA